MSIFPSIPAQVLAPIPSPHYPGILTNAESRRAFRKAWKRLVHGETALSAPHFLAFSLLLGRPLTVTFTPVSRPSKLANGRRPYDSLLTAAHSIALGAKHPERTAWLEDLGIEPAQRERLAQAAAEEFQRFMQLHAQKRL